MTKKNCMNCLRKLTKEGQGSKPDNRCSLDPDMKVNRRMHCDEWVGHLANDRPQHLSSVIKM